MCFQNSSGGLLAGCRERAVRETLRKSQAEAEAAASELERSQEVLIAPICLYCAANQLITHGVVVVINYTMMHCSLEPARPLYGHLRKLAFLKMPCLEAGPSYRRSASHPGTCAASSSWWEVA